METKAAAKSNSPQPSSNDCSIIERTVGNLVIAKKHQPQPRRAESKRTAADRRNSSPGDFDPVIVVLGWLNGQDRHVKKYSDLFCRLGGENAVAVRSLCDVDQGVWSMHASNEARVQELLGTLDRDEDLKGRPVILCAYSNGGCQVIEFLLRAAYSGDKAAKAFLQDRLAGYLFDSCPAKISAHAISTALAIGFKRQGWLASSAAYWLFYLLFSAWILFAVLGFSELRQDVLHSVLANDPSRVPTLFIYSDNDEITECGALENFIGRRAAICSTKVEGGPAATSCSDAASQEVRGQSSDTLEHDHKDGTSFGTRPTRKRSESRER